MPRVRSLSPRPRSPVQHLRLLLLVLLGGAEISHACSCGPQSEYASFLQSDLVFVGTTVDTTAPDTGGGNTVWTATFVVNLVLRGTPRDSVRVAMPPGGYAGGCGQVFTKDSSYLIFCEYSRYAGTDYFTSDCRMNRQITAQQPLGPAMEGYAQQTHFDPQIIGFYSGRLAIIVPVYGYRPSYASPGGPYSEDTSGGRQILRIPYTLSPGARDERDSGVVWFGARFENIAFFPVNGVYTVRLEPECSDTIYEAINCVTADIGTIDVTTAGVAPRMDRHPSTDPLRADALFDIRGRRISASHGRWAGSRGTSVLVLVNGRARPRVVVR